jgi:hypothetical protein
MRKTGKQSEPRNRINKEVLFRDLKLKFKKCICEGKTHQNYGKYSNSLEILPF